MPQSNNLHNLQEIQISDIQVGTFIVNLGVILEIDEKDNFFNLVISRMNEKQVIKFEKDVSLIIY
ncbi:hypothetical protein J7E50_02510 [Pedobacter sp. ISL-68]|uniref:hypothetical protein n=1 Tax=unclassified Pedobacter TaxID=2628915 RepID=UPI001BE52C08|nr:MULTISPECIES: hypothetical protein [unclassified Pedobacter]MBT2560093.1 hypothetical protein [Pedobacter sp. ISL-64]MBT2589072.1 hypothetical protein [Pedobacter sp. ISL-68]